MSTYTATGVHSYDLELAVENALQSLMKMIDIIKYNVILKEYDWPNKRYFTVELYATLK